MKVKLTDVAKEAKVSIATVSIVLNHPNTTRISKKTKEKVLAAADKLNYIPNLAAQTLVTNKTNTIGLLIPDIENPFFSSLSKHIELILRKKNYALIMMNTLEDNKNDPEVIKAFRMRNVDGLIIALSSKSFYDDEEILKTLSKLDKPFVLVDRVLKDFKTNQVYFDNILGEYIATKYLIDNGHKKIGYISTRDFAVTGYYRHKGYLKALEEAGIEPNEDYIRYGRYDIKTGYEMAESLYEEGVTAISCANDLIAFGLKKRLTEIGLNLPEDMSIVGYDNLELNDFIKDGLTSVNQDVESFAKHIVDILFDILNGKKEISEVVLEPSLKIRNSVMTYKE